MEDSQIVAAVRAELAARIGAQRFELWFGPQTQFLIGTCGLTVQSTTAFVRDWIRNFFADDVRACWEAINGQPAAVEFEVAARVPHSDEPLVEAVEDGSLLLAANGAESSDGLGQSACVAVVSEPVQVSQVRARAKSRRRSAVAAVCADSHGNANPSARGCEDVPVSADAAKCRREVKLGEFVVGASNEYAFRAAELTAHGRQQASPVLFYGSTGVGKTHLLRGIQREYRRRHPRAAAVYLTAEQFTTSFVEALRGSGLPSFRQKCRGADLFLLDDLQFFVGKAQKTAEELLYSIDALQTAGRQVVLGSDRDLAGLRALGPEFASRLAGGLVCQIGLPEFATRLGIVQRMAVEMRLAIEDDILSLVATQITAGARELRGALHRLQAMSLAYECPITREMAETALGELARQCTRPVRLADVQQVVCDVFGVEPGQLRSERKGRSLSEPRMLAMWLARKYTRVPWSEIGEFFGRKSHSTVISAHRRVEQLISAQGEIGLNDQACGVEEAIRRLETKLRTA